jgi:hypothetical protein
MTEANLSEGGAESAAAPICPWCSAQLVTGREETCPSCGAALHEISESEVPGVTQVDIDAVLRARTPDGQRGRGLIGWLSGEYEPEAAPDTPESIAPPEEAVRREMLRLELAALEAEVQGRQAEAEAEIVDAKIAEDDARAESGEAAETEDDDVAAEGAVSDDEGPVTDDEDAATDDEDGATDEKPD